MKILIIDDTKSIHIFVKSLLAPFQVDFQDVYNGQEGVDLLKSNSDFDLILLDWEMPIKNGPDTLVEIKKMNILPPVMMMTTKNAPNEILQMLNAGAAEYLMKPFTVDILLEKIEYVTGKSLKNAA